MEDKEILALFWARDERAVTETAEKYGGYCRAVARNILDSPEDCEECLSDAWWRLWSRIPPDAPERLGAYAARVTRNLALDRFRKNRAQKRGSTAEAALEELLDCVPADTPDAADTLALSAALNRFLAGLDRETRIIFLQRYWYLCPVKDIARGLKLGESKVKMTLFRARKKLREQLEEEGL